MKSRFQLILLIVLAKSSLLGEVNAKHVFQIAYTHNPPFIEHNPDGVPTGLLKEILTTLLARNDFEYEFNYFPPKRLFHHMRVGDFGQVQFMTNIPDTLGSEVLIDSHSVVSLKARVYWFEGKKPIYRLEDLANEKIVLVRGYNYGNTRLQIKNLEPSAAIVDVSNSDDAVKMLKVGRANYILTYRGLEEYMSIGDSKIALHYFVAEERPLYLTMHKSIEGGAEILKSLSDTLKIMQQSGEIEELLQDYVQVAHVPKTVGS